MSALDPVILGLVPRTHGSVSDKGIGAVRGGAEALIFNAADKWALGTSPRVTENWA